MWLRKATVGTIACLMLPLAAESGTITVNISTNSSYSAPDVVYGTAGSYVSVGASLTGSGSVLVDQEINNFWDISINLIIGPQSIGNGAFHDWMIPAGTLQPGIPYSLTSSTITASAPTWLPEGVAAIPVTVTGFWYYMFGAGNNSQVPIFSKTVWVTADQNFEPPPPPPEPAEPGTVGLLLTAAAGAIVAGRLLRVTKKAGVSGLGGA